jgi:uncharacterized UBP type Zn finger protein
MSFAGGGFGGGRFGRPPAAPHASLVLEPPTLELRYPGVGAGFSNLGNTCYLNSVLQALGASHYFQACHVRAPHRASCATASRTAAGATVPCVLCLLEEHFDHAGPLANRRGSGAGGVNGPVVAHAAIIVAPEAIVRNLKLVSPTLHCNVQQDAHDFLSLLSAAMQRSYRRPGPELGLPVAWPPPGAYSFTMFAGAVQSTVVCSVCAVRGKKKTRQRASLARFSNLSFLPWRQRRHLM